MSNYLMLIAAAVLLAFEFSMNKLYQRKEGASAAAGLCFNSINGLLTAIVFFCLNGFMNGFTFQLTPFSLLMAACMGIFCFTYNIIGLKMMKEGNMAQYTLFLMIGGMSIPYVFGIFALDEAFSLLRTLGLILIFGGVFYANFQKGQKINRTYLIMGVIVFCLNGLVSTVSKLHQIESVRPTVSAASFVMLAGLIRFFFCGIAVLLIKNKQKTLALPHPLTSVLPIILFSAIIGGGSYMLQLMGAQNLPATVLYPCITGGSIVFTTLAARLFFKEKITRQTGIGVLLCFAGMCCFL